MDNVSMLISSSLDCTKKFSSFAEADVEAEVESTAEAEARSMA
jgi:hypothetical protein